MMKNRLKYRINFFALMLGCVFLTSRAFAAPTEFNEIKKLETEQIKNPVRIDVPVVTYKSEGARDPFQEKVSGVGGNVGTKFNLSELSVQGIVWGGAFPQAIINNKVVKVGDTIKEARVIDISKDGVTVFLGGRQYNLNSPAVSQLQSIEDKQKGGTDEKK